LLNPIHDLPCWRWQSDAWPADWQEIQQKPLRTAFRRLLISPLRQAREMWRDEHKLLVSALLGTGLHQFLMAVTFSFFRLRR
jgi:hypothetical protein